MRILLITIIYLIFFSQNIFAFQSKISIKNLKVLDGDTVKVTFESGNKFSIRLIGIDCFETEPIHRAYKQIILT